MMKLSDIEFIENVSFSDMLNMAGHVVNSICDADDRLNRTLGQEYLYLQGATRLFTTYGVSGTDGDIEEFMKLVFSYGMSRYEQWLSDGAGKEKYEAFKRMVDRGCKYYLEKSGVEMLMDAATDALKSFTKAVEGMAGMDAETAQKIAQAVADNMQESDGAPQE